MLTGVFKVPVRALVCGSVVWNWKLAAIEVPRLRPQLVPILVELALMMVAKAVAVLPTCTERLAGNTAETTVTGPVAPMVSVAVSVALPMPLVVLVTVIVVGP